MMFRLTVISGGIPQSTLSCSAEERVLSSQTEQHSPIFETQENSQELSYEQVQKQCAVLNLEAPDSWRWKKKVFLLAIGSPYIESLFFVPSHLNKFQKIFATKGSREGYIDLNHFGERRDVRDLTNFAGMEGEQIEIAQKIVQVFTNDEETRAIALTFKHRFDQGFDTFIWSKNKSLQ